MAFKDVLLQLKGYPDASPMSAIDQGVGIAAMLPSKITALTFEFAIDVPATIVPGGFLSIGCLVEAERMKSVGNAKIALEAFATRNLQRGVAHDQLLERCTTAHIPGVVVGHAR